MRSKVGRLLLDVTATVVGAVVFFFYLLVFLHLDVLRTFLDLDVRR